MTSTESFPYGNDPDNPHLWAGLANTKSHRWLALYHSGVSFGAGTHTILFFGRENLIAIIASLTGVGPQVTWGIKAPVNKIQRSGGVSKEIQHISERITDKIEKSEQLHSAARNAEDLDSLKSAKSIYNAIAKWPSKFIATVPFCANDIQGKSGTIYGFEAGAVIGAASSYRIEAFPYFVDALVYNYSKEKAIISASAGALKGFWRVIETYSLWNELAYSETEEYPFRGYDVDPLFHQYRNPKPMQVYNSKLYDIATKAATNRNAQARNMGLPATQMLKVMDKTDSLYSDFLSRMSKGENLIGHPLMKDIPYNMHHMFVGK